MSCATQNLTILKGETLTRVIRWQSSPLIYKPITGITQAAPAVVTATGHGVPDGWRVAVLSAGGMREINAKVPAKGKPPLESEFRKATVLTANTIELNEVSSLDFTAYTSGGALVYYTPIDMSGFTARLHVRATATAADPPLLTLTTENGGIAIDNTAKTITLTVTAAQSAALTFSEGVYDLEVVSAGGLVTRLLEGLVAVSAEVTR